MRDGSRIVELMGGKQISRVGYYASGAGSDTCSWLFRRHSSSLEMEIVPTARCKKVYMVEGFYDEVIRTQNTHEWLLGVGYYRKVSLKSHLL